MSLYDRAGAAFGQGAPIGASMDAAKSTSTTAQASSAGKLFSQGSAFGVAPTAPGDAFGTQAKNQQALANAQATGAAQTRIGDQTGNPTWVDKYINHPIAVGLQAIGKPVEWESKRIQTGWRVNAHRSVSQQLMWGAQHDPSWDATWAQVGQAHASLGQTVWLSLADSSGNNPAGDNAEPWALLDDPQFNSTHGEGNFKTARDEYFGSGWAHWTTGTFDAAFNWYMDPTVAGGKYVSSARAMMNTVKATDVAAAASDAANLTRGAKRVNAVVDGVVDASERVRTNKVAGGYADLSQTKFLSQSADAGAIPYALSRADGIVDDAERLALKRQIMFAGMGDRTSLEALQGKNADLALEIQALNSPNRFTAMTALLAREDLSHADKLKAIDDDTFIDSLIQTHTEEIRKTIDSLKRTTEVGTSGATVDTALKAATPGVGDLANFTKTNDLVKVGSTIHRGAALPRVQILVGRHIPGTISLSGSDAYTSFKAVTDEMRVMFKGNQAVLDKLDNLEERFALAPGATDPAAARAARRPIVDELHSVAERAIAGSVTTDPRVRQQVVSMVREIRNNRTAEVAHVKERSMRAVGDNSNIAHTASDDGTILTWDTRKAADEAATPFDGSQLEDMAVLPSYKSIRHTLQTRLAAQGDGLEGHMRQVADGTWKFTEAGLSAFNDLWKFGALFRLGYPIRNLVDSQARMLAMVGGLQYMRNLAKGSTDFLYNAKRIPTSLAEDAATKAAARTRLDWLQGMPETDDVLSQRQALQNIIDAPAPAAVEGEAKVKRGQTELGRYLGIGGRGSAYSSVADMRRQVDSVDARLSTLNLVTDFQRSTLNDLRASQHWETVTGDSPLWEQAYLDMVNRHVRNSSPMMSMLAGADDASIIKYYQEDPAGRAVWKGLAPRYRNDVTNLVATQREQLANLVPTELADQVIGGDLTAARLKAFYGDARPRPAVPAQMLETAKTTPFTVLENMYNWSRSAWFKWASETPETMLGRHPFYVARKEMHLSRAIENAGGNADALTISEYNRMSARAAILAKRDVGNYMFDTSQRSNLGHHLRFLSPFYAAWSDTMRKWGRIAGENLEVLPAIPKTFMAPNAMYTVVDNDGNRILKNGDVVDANGNVIRHSADFSEGNILLGVPEWMTKWTGGSDTVKVSKSSLNVIFQGNPWWLPGPGPLASVPANAIATKVFPEALDSNRPDGYIFRYLLPYGSDAGSVVDQSMPMWAQNLKTALSQNFSDDRYAQTYAMLMAQEQNAERTGQSKQLTQTQLESKVANQTRNWFLLRFLGSEAPFSTSPTGRLDYWRQEWQRYQRTYPNSTRLDDSGQPMSARDAFFADYPDYFEATISLSANETGIAATDDAWNQEKKYAPEIAADPQYGWMYVGAKNLAPGFSQGVYTAQKVNGSRTTKDPRQAFTDLQVGKGWYDYQKVAGALDLKLQERAASGGSASITANSNADLKAIKDKFVSDLLADNPQWADDYQAGSNGQKTGQFLRAADQAIQERPELAKRGDFQALTTYMQVRAAMQQKLAERGLKNIDAKGAADLKAIWDNFTLELRSDDLGFQQMFTRVLSKDDLTQGG